jgi:hypothetical protein
MMLFVAALYSPQSGAQEMGVQVTVRIAAVKENDWQREMAKRGKPDELRERLQARTLVELTGVVKEEGATVLRSGETRDVITEWKFDRAKDQAVAKKTLPELVGTEVRLHQEPPKNHAGAARISLTLTHDLSPPQVLSLPYANAAVGTEREKHIVTTPLFERLRWQGEVLVGVKERMIAHFRPANDAATRIVVFFKGSGGSIVAPSLEVQQTIYRVPELAMIEWLLQGWPDDTALADHLQKAVSAGQASIVSSAAFALAPNASTEMQTGTDWWLPTESDQIFDRLYLPPVAFSAALEGTRLKASATGGFESFYTPLAPLAVQWPTSWLRVADEHGAHTKAIHGWMDWYDRFEQKIVGTSLSDSTSPQLVAMMPPADQAWGTNRRGRWLDITMAQLSGDVPKPAAQPATPEPLDPFAPPANPFTTGWSAQPPTLRSLILGIALDTSTAHALLLARQPEQDEALLRDLLALVKRGEARIVTSALSACNSNFHSQTSARIHAYPTEMPSIPSAWEDAYVGTRLEQNGDRMSLIQSLAPPGRSEWKLACDMPEAIMWQPRFRTLSMNTWAFALTTPGTHLLSAATVPAVMADTDFPAHETVLLFNHLDPGANTPAVTGQDYEIEALIFEASAQNATAWREVKSADFESFSQRHIKSGKAKLESHSMLRTRATQDASLSLIELYRTATEFDPPTRHAPFRMRPTALQELPVGLQLTANVTEEADGSISLHVKLKHSTAKPIEPSLEETLRISADENEPYPGAKHELDEWNQGLSLSPGKFYCLLPPITTSSDKETTRSAWVRVRAVK